MEIVSGIILGLDTDTPDAATGLIEFIERSQIPMLTINLLQALPRTPLWDRLAREGRLVEDDDRESNVEFRLPYDEVVAMWRDCMAQAYRPDAVFDRYRHQVSRTYPNRLRLPHSPQRASWRNIRRALGILGRLLWAVGACGDYRREFWKFALPLLARGDIERVIAVGIVAHHLVVFAREAVAGRRNASHYSDKLPEFAVAAE
jgi:hopanoid C-2 methylase